MAQKRNRVKEFLDRSPWALGAVVIAAVLSFFLSALEQGWRLYERMKEPPPPSGAIEVASQRGFEMVEATESLRKIPVVQQALSADKLVYEILQKESLTARRVPMWPIELLILNPTEETLNLHSCQMTVRSADGKLPTFSFGYLVPSGVNLQSDDFQRIITVEPQGVRRVRLVFVFADLHHRHYQEPSLFRPVYIDILCRDQERREMRTTHPIYSQVRSSSK